MTEKESRPRTVLMDDELWGDANEAASDRQKRTRRPTSASDIVRDGTRILAREEIAGETSERIARQLVDEGLITVRQVSQAASAIRFFLLVESRGKAEEAE